MKWIIYCHTHIDSGRRYIGLTSQTMERRWQKHVNAAFRFSKGGRWHFPNAIRKHGPRAFSHEVLAMSWTLEGANYTEKTLILQYETQNPEKGFNLSKGGGSHIPHEFMIKKNPWDNLSYRNKCISSIRYRAMRGDISRANSQRIIKESTRENLSILSKNMWLNESIRQQISKSNIGKISSETRVRMISTRKQNLEKHVSIAELYTCKIHGVLSIEETYKFKSLSSNTRLGFVCKICKSERNARRKSRSKVFHE